MEFPKINNIDVIWVVMDKLIKNALFCGNSHLFSTNIMKKLFIQNIQKIHRISKIRLENTTTSKFLVKWRNFPIEDVA